MDKFKEYFKSTSNEPQKTIIETVVEKGSRGPIGPMGPFSTTASIPIGKHLYDLELIIGNTYANRILEGRVDIIGETTR